ncbi:coiled-coil domain-containing protein 13 [Drosophila grimshawi]|uniref:GH16218 n=1 Tax=Drosophila grimshawi TaxID=7222 RepID=B4IXE8_DROGR|nr:coiled-coil domain-containing protein 13 [Drosophila grimshawi]EDV96385.1 GH16218 [Drosophila grimshawi]
MDVLPEDGTDIEIRLDGTIQDNEVKEVKEKTRKLSRRKREHEKNESHVVVATAAVKAKLPKPEGKKLRKKLIEFEQENQTLAKTISDKNQEICALKQSVDSLNEVLNSVPMDELRCNSSIASSKILELSKKNRQMRAELEQLKNRVLKKEMHIEKLEKERKNCNDKMTHNGEQAKKGTAADELQAKINSMQQKFFETRNKNTELQNQLKLAQKCLQHEVGETVNINLLANNLGQASWRGRAQQILTLQQKLQELKVRMESYEQGMPERGDYVPIAHGSELERGGTQSLRGTPRGVKPMNSPGRNSTTLSVGGGDGCSGGATFDRFTPGVRKSEILHRAKVETLEKEIEALRAQLDEQRNRTLALKVRNKTLNDDMLKYKMRSTELEENSDYSATNASSMTDKLKAQRAQYETRLDDLRNDVIRIAEDRDIARRQMDELSGMNLELHNELKQKDSSIQALQDTIKKLETDLRAITGGFLFSCREFRKEEFVGILDALEVEKNQLLLLNKAQEERLEVERLKNESAVDQIAKQKTRLCRMEVKIRDLEKELDVQTDRKKRSQRITEYANQVGRIPLTGSISSFSFDNQSQCPSISSMGSMISSEPKIEDIKNELELANEKITMLTEKLEYITAEKRADAKFFEETMSNSKNIILDTILGAREGAIQVHPTLDPPPAEFATSDSS